MEKPCERQGTGPDPRAAPDVAPIVMASQTYNKVDNESIDGEATPTPTPTEPDPAATNAKASDDTKENHHSSRTPRRARNFIATHRDFYATFGALGAPSVVALLLCAATMFFLAVVQVLPTTVANWVMDTATIDGGEFWLLSTPPTAFVVVSATLLVCFGGCYLALALTMVFFRGRMLRWVLSHHQPRTRAKSTAVIGQGHGHDHPHPHLSPTQGWFRYELLSLHGAYHTYYNALFDLPKLAFQTATITTYLSEGFPLPMIQLYLTALLVSWLLAFYRFQHQHGDPHYVVARLFLLFDLFFSVFAPMLVLAYAYQQFNMDRRVFAIREATLSRGSFDRVARIFADPVQVALFRFGFGHLQFTQPWYIVTKTSLNVLGVYKWKKVLVLLLLHHADRETVLKQQGQSHGNGNGDGDTPVKTASTQRTPSFLHRAFRVQEKRRHLVVGMAVFFASIVAITTYVVVSIITSTRNCHAIPHCRVIAYRWRSVANDACPCIVYINRDEAPRTYQEWINATDATQSLAAAATSGDLQIVQIVNRAVPALPDALQHCHNMEQLILVYTQTQSLPDWVGNFEGLIYIHIESNLLHYPLHTLPSDLFSRMTGLRFIRFGGAAHLPEFPSLAGLEQLTTLVLSLPHGLALLPSLDDLTMLVTLFIADATHVTRLPSLQKLTKLNNFSLFRRNAMCCNGFLTGTCDLADFQCQPRTGETPVTCEPSRLPHEDRERLKHIDAFVCDANLTTDIVDSEPTVATTDSACGGVLFRQCQLGERVGVCFNGRMEVIHCDADGEFEAMRRREIASGVGVPCDPQVEAWLGCGALL